MDLAQMLVVGGCAVIGASLGVTFWRVSQTGLFKRLMSKKKKIDQEAEEDQPDVSQDGEIEDAEIISDVASSDEGNSQEDIEETQEDQMLADESMPELDEEPDGVAIADYEEGSDDFAAHDGAMELDEASFEPEGVLGEVEESSGGTAPPVDALTLSIEFQEKTAQALTEIADRLGDALVRLERLEASVESQISASETPSASPMSRVLGENIEISDLPIAAAPSDLDGIEDEEFSDELPTEAPPDDPAAEFAEALAEPDPEPEESSMEELEEPLQETSELVSDLPEEPPDETIIAEETDELVLAEESDGDDPLDLPRVIGI